MTRQVIINADDLGLAESVNRGILESIANGVVTSASLMVNMEASGDAVRRLKELRLRGGTPSVGLHFNIVTGAPLAQCGTLTHRRTGQFLPLQGVAWRAFAGRVGEEDVERELGAQFQRARDLLAPIGMSITHIDSHRHAHCLPGVFDTVLRFARDHGVAHVRHPLESPRTLLQRPHAVIGSWVLRAALRNRSALDAVGFAGTAMLGSRSFERDLLAIVSLLSEGTTELMVHPGYDSPALAALDPYPRESELRALTSPLLRDRIRGLGVELTHFGAGAAAVSGSTRGEPAAS